jgi:hypothetical protein
MAEIDCRLSRCGDIRFWHNRVSKPHQLAILLE